MDVAAPVAPNREEIYSWLSTVYHGMPGYLCVFSLPSRRSQFFKIADDLDVAASQAAVEAGSQNVYTATCALDHVPPPGDRGGGNLTSAMPGLRIDLDVDGPAHKGNGYPPTVEAVMEMLDELGITPTTIVNSGGGLQAWWLFDRPWVFADDDDRQKASVLSARLVSAVKEIAATHGWKVDATQDLARVLRVPGTINRKLALAEPLLVTITKSDGPRHRVVDLEVLLPQPKVPEPPERRPPPPPLEGEHKTASEILDGWSWHQILEPHGFFELRQKGTGIEWGHPAQTSPKGTPAATTDAKGPVLVVFSQSSGDVLGLPTGEGHKLTKLRAFAILNHGGDESAAARTIWEVSYPGWVPATDLRSLLPTNHRQRDPSVPAILTGPYESSDTTSNGNGHHAPLAEWTEPIPLMGNSSPGPFPLDALPSWITDYAQASAIELQAPVDLCIQVALGALSAVAAGRVKVAVTDIYRENVNLYLATAMGSGSGKSPADKRMAAPLKTFVAERDRQLRDEASEAQLRQELLARQLETAMKEATKPGGDVDEAIRIQKLLNAAPKPPSARMLIDDATPEAITQQLDLHGGRLAMISSEASLLDHVCGAYSHRVNLDVFLKAWSGDQIIVDRKGGADRKATQINIPEALLTIAVTVQPHALTQLRAHPELAGRGFTARFMYSMPTDLRGVRDHSTLKMKADKTITDRYETTYLAIARRLASYGQPVAIPLTDEALDLFIEWKQRTEPRIGPGGDLRHLAEWVAKQQASVLRMTGLIHVAEGRHHADPIGVDIMAKAIRVGEYWADHASAVSELWHGDENAEMAMKLWEWILAHGDIRPVSLRDAYRGLRRSVTSSGDLLPAFGTLVEHGYLQALFDGDPRTGKGVKSPEWAVNPLVGVTHVTHVTSMGMWGGNGTESPAPIDVGSNTLSLYPPVHTPLSKSGDTGDTGASVSEPAADLPTLPGDTGDTGDTTQQPATRDYNLF